MQEKDGNLLESGSRTTSTASVMERPPGPRGPPPEILLAKSRLILLSTALCLGLFLSFLDSSIVSTALVTIGTDFNSLSNINWVALAYTLCDLGCAVMFTSMSDVIGRRNAYVVAFVLFFSGSIGCGFARSINQLIALRSIQGIGGSGLYSLAMVMFPEIFPRAMRKWIGAVAGGVVGTSGIMGPILGGVITRFASWKWIFWINAPIGIISITIFLLAWPNKDQMCHAERKPLKQLDVVGSFLLITASVLVVFAFQESGVHPNFWGTALFIAPLATGAICWFLLVGWEVAMGTLLQDSISPLFPRSLFTRRVYVSGALTALITGFPYYVVIYNVPLHLQIVNGKSPLTAGLGLLPLLFTTAIGSMLGGAISSKKDLSFYTLTVGSCLMTLGTGLLSTISTGSAVDPKLYGFQVFVGLGFGLSVSTSSILAAIQCELKDHATAQGIVAQARVLGGSFGIAASTAILGVIKGRELFGIVSPAQLVALNFSTLDSTQAHAVRLAYAHAFRHTLRVSTILSGISIVFAFSSFQKEPPTLAERAEQQIQFETARQMAKHRQRGLQAAPKIAGTSSRESEKPSVEVSTPV
ncbi:MFS multidrug transporter-like protein [Mollisia scopiformis]|uniref:MFS multidrug transporter-like protein n=1 Tax=Mollisia scopiformis TaxID=149040 RepID=A0A194X002_MOLSC|nr:MFS multidrug transporter-like protein [Mollisia scopiformis]KUJ13197.1 MFS multidrug transporter-like protein [Mollisia scopiformis]